MAHYECLRGGGMLKEDLHPETFLYPFKMTCGLQDTSMFPPEPSYISVVARKCDKPTNFVKVVYKPLEDGEEQKDFVLCAKVRRKLDPWLIGRVA